MAEARPRLSQLDARQQCPPTAAAMSSQTARGAVWGIVVTYYRPAALKEMVTRLSEQTQPPDHLIVVDNGSDRESRLIAERAGASYIDAGGNLGPAGAVALGMEHVLAEASDDDWIALFDDDDPPRNADLLEQLQAFGESCLLHHPRTAAVGLTGSRYNRRTGVFVRVPDEELQGRIPVDYIGGGQFPLYSCRAVREVGVFDGDFFFGFEEGEYGLRLRRHGYRLFAEGGLWRAERQFHGRMNLAKGSLRAHPQKAAWRRYYSVRNATVLAKRYGHPLTPGLVAIAGGLRGAVALARVGRPAREVVMPIRGALHGLTGKTGKVVDPGQAQKTA